MPFIRMVVWKVSLVISKLPHPHPEKKKVSSTTLSPTVLETSSAWNWPGFFIFSTEKLSEYSILPNGNYITGRSRMRRRLQRHSNCKKRYRSKYKQHRFQQLRFRTRFHVSPVCRWLCGSFSTSWRDHMLEDYTICALYMLCRKCLQHW